MEMIPWQGTVEMYLQFKTKEAIRTHPLLIDYIYYLAVGNWASNYSVFSNIVFCFLPSFLICLTCISTNMNNIISK